MSEPDAPNPEAPRFTTVIQPRPGWHMLDLREVWAYRHLLWILAKRDLTVRYKQTVIGAAWAIIQPLTTMVIFTVLFKLLGRFPADPAGGIPYAVTTYCGLLPWQLFAGTLTQSSQSLVANGNLLKKVYFPRVIIPLTPMLVGLTDFAIAFTILVLMMFWYGITPGIGLLTLPLLIGFAMLTSFAVALWFSALNALYRDIGYALPFVIQIGMFLSPVVYETGSMIPERYQWLYSLNPLVGVLEGFRWALLGRAHPPLTPMAISATVVALLLVGGALYFRRVERTLADKV